MKRASIVPNGIPKECLGFFLNLIPFSLLKLG